MITVVNVQTNGCAEIEVNNRLRRCKNHNTEPIKMEMFGDIYGTPYTPKRDNERRKKSMFSIISISHFLIRLIKYYVERFQSLFQNVSLGKNFF